MFNKKHILKYSSEYGGLVNDLVPVKKHIPDWYKSIKSYSYNNLVFDNESKVVKNVKSCIPFLDSFMTGYSIELWCDLHVRKTDDGQSHYFTWGDATPRPMDFRDPDINPIPVPTGCEPSHYVWKSPYCLKTPKGYSLLITHPLNRFDLPFVTLSGIVDAEKTIGPGNFPFFIKKDFEGLIESGTPIFQVIPFKKENWNLENDDKIIKEGLINKQKSLNVFAGFYKKNFWIKKSYD